MHYPASPRLNCPHIRKENIPVQHGISGLITSMRSCDRCGTFHSLKELVTGASVGKRFFRYLCATCASPKPKMKEELK